MFYFDKCVLVNFTSCLCVSLTCHPSLAKVFSPCVPLFHLCLCLSDQLFLAFLNLACYLDFIIVIYTGLVCPVWFESVPAWPPATPFWSSVLNIKSFWTAPALHLGSVLHVSCFPAWHCDTLLARHQALSVFLWKTADFNPSRGQSRRSDDTCACVQDLKHMISSCVKWVKFPNGMSPP